MKKQMIRSFRSRSALEDFLERTVVHEEAGAHMPGILVHCALLGAISTMAIGALGIVTSPGSTSEFAGFINAIAWIAFVFGGLLLISGLYLSESRNARSRQLMKYQLIAGTIVPVIIPLVLVGLYVAIGVFLVWLMFAILWALIDP